MKLFPGCLLAVLFAFAYCPGYAQTAPASIQGKVYTVKGEPADAATIVLMKSADSSVVRSTISNNKGFFNFENIGAGSYLVFVTKLNYSRLYAGPYQVVGGKVNNININTLEEASTQLKDVTITGKKDFVEIKPDRTILNVDENISAAGGSVYDVLATSPGVKIQGGEILYRGGQKALIAINGKPVLLTGDELESLLKNYQSSSISQIELLQNPGSKYGANASGGVINIILKKNKELGSKVTLTESAGIGDKYRLTSGIIYNLRTEKLNLFASYGIQDGKVPHTIYNNRNILTGGDLYNFNLNYRADIKSVNNNFNIGGDYQLAKGQTIGFLVNGFDNNVTYDKLNTTTISKNGQLDSTINTHSVIHRDIKNISYNLNYKANLNKEGTSVLTANGDYTDYRRGSNEVLQNDFVNSAGVVDGILFYQDKSPSHITIRSANIDFSQALSKTSHLEAGIRSSRVSSDNQIDFAMQTPTGYKTDSSLTDHFVYNERINAAYLSYDAKFGNISISAGLRGEQTKSSAVSASANNSVDGSYFNLFPNINLSQNLSKNNVLTLSYNRNITRPNYQDLNPFVGYVDQFYYSTGNPFLKPAYVNTYQVSDFLWDKYRVSFTMAVTNNYFETVFEQNDSTKRYISTIANLGTRHQYILGFDVPVDITSWWHADINANLEHDDYNYTLDAIVRRSNNEYNINIDQNFKITKKLSGQLIGYYDSPAYYAISHYTAYYYLNAALSYSILNNKGSIRLAANDIFNSLYNKYHTNFANLDIDAKDKRGSRFVIATFVYHFGTSTARNRNKTTDERKRLGSSSNEN